MFQIKFFKEMILKARSSPSLKKIKLVLKLFSISVLQMRVQFNVIKHQKKKKKENAYLHERAQMARATHLTLF